MLTMKGPKSEVVVVPDSYGRDAGKHFLITEADAFAVEKWAWRAALVLKGTTAEIPLDVARLGSVAVMIRAINAVLAADIDERKFLPLLDEMLTCVQMIRDPGTVDKTTGRPVATPILPGTGSIMEAKTIGWLRSEVVRVHTSFTVTAALSELISTLARAGKKEEDSSTT